MKTELEQQDIEAFELEPQDVQAIAEKNANNVFLSIMFGLDHDERLALL
jgi:hypothetical protein